MKGYRLAASCLLVGTLLASGQASAGEDRPFKATLSINETVAPTGNPPWETCFSIGQITGAGNAIRLGSISASSTDCINPANAAGTLLVFASNQFVLTAANGDTLLGGYIGTLSVDPATGMGLIEGTFYIGGGTGSFAGAKGAGTMKGAEFVNFAAGTGQGQIELNGNLTY